MTIKQKQCLLAYLGYYTGIPDGIWGRLSTEATKAFQATYGLEADGIFGTTTEKRILEVVATGEKPVAEKLSPTADWWKDIQNFTRAEFRCTCGRCGGFPVEPDEKLVRTVQAIRDRLGIPVSIVDAGGSGVRCPEHNAAVGGVWNSEHIYGRAADLHANCSPEEMYAAAEAVMGKTGGIGKYSWGIHVDVGKYSRWCG